MSFARRILSIPWRERVKQKKNLRIMDKKRTLVLRIIKRKLEF